MANLKKNLEYFIKDIYYIVPVVLIAILSFGFVLTHYSVNIDTLSADRYFREGELLAQERFGTIIIDKIFNVMDFNPFFVDFLAVIFLMLAAITFCILFRNITKDKMNKVVYTIFSCLFISYPLISEIFLYTPASLTIGLGYFGVAVCMNFMYNYMNNKNIKYPIYTTIILTIITRSYESFASVYLCGMFIILILEFIYGEENLKLKQTIIRIFKFLIPLIIAVILGKVIAVTIMKVYDLTKSKHGAKQIIDFSDGIGKTIYNLIASIVKSFFVKGLFYLPIFILDISIICALVVATIYSIKRKNIIVFLLFLGMLISLIALSMIQGVASPYRTCQVFAVFIAFTFMAFAQLVLNSSLHKIIKNIVIIIIFIIVFYQAKDLHKDFYLNYLRYQSEKETIISVANELQNNYDVDKPIVFVGGYELPKYIVDEAYSYKETLRYKILVSIFKDSYIVPTDRISETNMNSYLNWAMYSFSVEDSNPEIFKWLDMLGYGFKQGTIEMLKEAKDMINELKRYPEKGYILEMEDYIIVRL